MRFASYEADFDAGELRKNDIRIKIQAKPLAILAALIERPGELVSREELHKALWPDETFVDFDKNLGVAVNKLRDALSDSANEPRFIETVPRRGYRFLAPIESAEPVASIAPPVAEETHKAWPQPRLIALTILCVALLLIAIQFIRRPRFESANPLAAGNASIAVLPFTDMSSSKDQEYLSDGLSEELIGRLARTPGLKIAGRSSAFQFKGKNEDLRGIGQKLGVTYVLEGSVRKEGQRVRIMAELIKVDDGFQVWSESFDRNMDDILKVEDDIGAAVTAALPSRVLGRSPAIQATPRNTNPEAHDAYLYGRYFWNKRTPEGFDKAKEYFNQAIAKDPGYAAAYAGLADSYLLLGENRIRPHKDVYPKARNAAERALELDPGMAEPHASLGALDANEGNSKDAEREFQRAVQINPGYATAHQWYAELLGSQGRSQQALAEIRRGRDLDPLSLVVNTQVGWILFLGRRYDEAIDTLRKVIEMDPEFDLAHANLGLVYDQKGMYTNAISELRKSVELSGQLPIRLVWLAYAYARAGQKEQALRLRTKLEEPARRNEVAAPEMAILDIALGDEDRAVVRLKNASANHSLERLSAVPTYDPLRAPRYARFFPAIEPLSANAADSPENERSTVRAF